MEQERIFELLTRKVAGEATARELQELDFLLAKYPDSLYYEETLRQLWQKNEMFNDETELAFKRHQDRHAEEFQTIYSENSNATNRTSLKRALLVAAVLVPLTFIGILFVKFFSIKPESKQIELVSGKGIRKKVVLPDGTLVWLNAGSQLSYNKGMTSLPTRTVVLTGEAFFDVVKNTQKPFIIQTEKFTIKVLGTAFNVKAYAKERKAEATLLRGTIELSLKDNPQQKILLKPKEKFAISDIGDETKSQADKSGIERQLVIEKVKPVEISNQQYLQETSWIENKLVFKNESLEELIPRLELWYNVSFKIENTAVKSYRFTGVFRNENIQQALTAMQLIHSFNFKIKENDEIIIN